ncbi:hypothetical protein Pcinc_008764 [Petrolisthes cinctipes]|uniref:Uncharacterized protein n=1 Tax=Petrolisthes cinctipes TaxID=88211 RepID=A0AAE1G5X9_PETCI|nr:hypothetical protein Pcinc_008764 [Petrolisthes cinctipes]
MERSRNKEENEWSPPEQVADDTGEGVSAVMKYDIRHQTNPSPGLDHPNPRPTRETNLRSPEPLLTQALAVVLGSINLSACKFLAGLKAGRAAGRSGCRLGRRSRMHARYHSTRRRRNGEVEGRPDMMACSLVPPRQSSEENYV